MSRRIAHPILRRAWAAAGAVALLTAAFGQSVPAAAQATAESSHMTLIGHLAMSSGGEGFAEKMLAGGKRLLYVAHESGPHCFTIADVTDPSAPQLVRTVDVPVPGVRCNSLDLNANVLVVAAETPEQGQPGGGIRVYALDDPANPRLVAYFDTSGPHSRGVHHVWLSSPTLAHITSGAADFTPNRARPDDQIYRIVDLSDPAHPKEAGRWWYPGQRAGDAEPAPVPVPMANMADNAVRPHNIDVFPSRPNRAYVAYLDAGLVILDIGDLAYPRAVGSVRYVGPFTHTAFPIFARNLLAVSEEDTQDNCTDEPKRISIWDIADETKPRLLSVVPYAANSAELCKRGGRFGPHNLYEDKPYGPTYESDRFLVSSWFGGGVRIFDLADPVHPAEAAYYVPAAPLDSPKHAPQINDVFVDDRGVIFACDRYTGGLYVLRSDVLRP